MSEPETAGREPLRAADRQEEDRPSFRVIDRRRFAPDGSERSEGDEAASGEAPREQAPPSTAAPSAQGAGAEKEPPAGAGAAASRGAAASDPNLGMPHGEPYEERTPGGVEPSFGTLLISLSTQALMHLGEIPDLEGGETRKDLEAARNIIDLIAVLERKTRGNLDSDEAALLERILYDLRMRFVALSRG